MRHCLNCSTLSRSLLLTPLTTFIDVVDVVVCSSKPGGLSELDEDDDEDDDDEDDECVDEADEHAAEPPDWERFLLISLVINKAAASISSLISVVGYQCYKS